MGRPWQALGVWAARPCQPPRTSGSACPSLPWHRRRAHAFRGNTPAARACLRANRLPTPPRSWAHTGGRLGSSGSSPDVERCSPRPWGKHGERATSRQRKDSHSGERRGGSACWKTAVVAHTQEASRCLVLWKGQRVKRAGPGYATCVVGSDGQLSSTQAARALHANRLQPRGGPEVAGKAHLCPGAHRVLPGISLRDS